MNDAIWTCDEAAARAWYRRRLVWLRAWLARRSDELNADGLWLFGLMEQALERESS